MTPVGAARSGIIGAKTGAAIPTSGLAHWYDATDISGSDGDAIGTWADQEGADDLTESTSSKKPTLKTGQINGNQVLRFDGSDDNLSTEWTDLAQPNHFFIVYQILTESNGTFFSREKGGDSGRNVFFVERIKAMFAGSSVDGSATDTNPHIGALLFDGGNSVLRIDGVDDATGDVGNDDASSLIVGAGQDETDFINADIGELLVYDAGLSASDRNDVESYLSDKWGISI